VFFLISPPPSIITNKVDTLKVVTEGQTQLIYAKDSIVVNEPGVYIKAKTNGDSLMLFYEFLPDTIYKIITKTVFNVPKTRQIVRLEAKKERNQVKFKHKEEIMHIKKGAAVEQTKLRQEAKQFSRWPSFLLGIIVGFFVFFFLMLYLNKKHFFS